ncbi:MAG: hypothetical protein PHU14_08600 [Methylovulum sp.]|nr:hypothetical protein [Methylovulum sp.]
MFRLTLNASVLADSCLFFIEAPLDLLSVVIAVAATTVTTERRSFFPLNAFSTLLSCLQHWLWHDGGPAKSPLKPANTWEPVKNL